MSDDFVRFQLDLTPDELDSIGRWSGVAGFRTKKEFLLNAFTLFRWAAKQVMLGRTICAVNEATGEIRHLEMPALSAIADSYPPPALLSPEEVKRRAALPGRPLKEVLADIEAMRTRGDDSDPGSSPEPEVE